MKNINLGSLILRVSLGLMMLLHGVAKLGSGVAPILMIVGLRTRLAAMIFVMNCIFIILLGPYNIAELGKYGGWNAELPGLFLFGALALVFTGGGNYAFSKQNKWD